LPGLISAAERELSARLRSLLHDPDWQALEATWRGLDFLIRRCPDEERVHYHVLDASLEELAADPAGLQRLLRDESWNVIIGLFTFGETAADLETLNGLGELARSFGAALLAGAHPQLVGCDSFDRHPDPDDWKAALPPDVTDAWQNLRAAAAAAHIGLALPRFLLRQPYGKAGDAIERFAFEEMIDECQHEHFLWGNSALLGAQLLIEGHAAGERVAAGNLAGLGAGRFIQHGGTALKPCAENWLVDRAAEGITRKGLIAVQSFKGRDAAQIAGLHAICHPDKPSRIIG
jgi:type VI secretion system ImpC/EvpB family protein